MGSSHFSYEIGKKVEAEPVGRAYIHTYIHAGILDLLLKDRTAEENLEFSLEFFRVGWEQGSRACRYATRRGMSKVFGSNSVFEDLGSAKVGLRPAANELFRRSFVWRRMP